MWGLENKSIVFFCFINLKLYCTIKIKKKKICCITGCDFMLYSPQTKITWTSLSILNSLYMGGHYLHTYNNQMLQILPVFESTFFYIVE